MTENIAASLQKINQRISLAIQNANRNNGDVQLITVSKTFPSKAIREAYLAGSRDFGENYVQELISKSEELKDLDVIWHFIGPLQSNKTRAIAEIASWVHSIDRLKIAMRLSEQRPHHLPPLNVCLQVNVSGELSKSGCNQEELANLANEVSKLPNLKLRGLMCIPDPQSTPEILREQFASLRKLQHKLNMSNLTLDVLSMGMSADLELAIAEGATHVRVGSAIFGQRNYHNE